MIALPIFLGVLALLAYIQLAALRNIDLSAIFPPEQFSAVQEQVAT